MPFGRKKTAAVVNSCPCSIINQGNSSEIKALEQPTEEEDQITAKRIKKMDINFQRAQKKQLERQRKAVKGQGAKSSGGVVKELELYDGGLGFGTASQSGLVGGDNRRKNTRRKTNNKRKTIRRKSNNKRKSIRRKSSKRKSSKRLSRRRR